MLTQDIEQLFPADRVEVIDTAPEEMDRVVRSWDLAASTHRASSYTSGALIGCDYGSNQVVITDMVTGRWDAAGVLSILAATAHHDGTDTPILIEEEKGSSGKLLLEQVARQLPDHRIIPGKLTGDKVTRAYGLASRVGAGKVAVVADEWTDGFLSELGYFPFGAHEDQVDAAVHGFNHLEAERAGSTAERAYGDRLSASRPGGFHEKPIRQPHNPRRRPEIVDLASRWRKDTNRTLKRPCRHRKRAVADRPAHARQKRGNRRLSGRHLPGTTWRRSGVLNLVTNTEVGPEAVWYSGTGPAVSHDARESGQLVGAGRLRALGREVAAGSAASETRPTASPARLGDT